MGRKGIVALIVSLVMAVCLCPCLAFATSGDLEAGSLELTTQARNLGNCQVKFTDTKHVGGTVDGGKYDATYQTYYVKGSETVAKPTFDLYYNDKKVSSSSYNVTYKYSYWKGDKEYEKVVSKSKLMPSISPSASVDDMSTSFEIIITPKSSSYTGELRLDIVVVDQLSLGRYTNVNMDYTLGRYNINPMNNGYFLIKQANVKKALNSITVRVAGSDDPDSGIKVDPKYYTVTYYKAKTTKFVEQNMSPASEAKASTKLSGIPTAPGSYVAIIAGKSPFYGQLSFCFDIQGSMSDVTVDAIGAKVENGKEIKPALTVKYKGTTLKEGIHYTVTYKNNVKAGTATATIKGCNVVTNNRGGLEDGGKARYFSGSKSVTFKIKKHATKTWKDNTMTVAGKTVKVSASSLSNGQQQGTGTTIKQAKAFKLADAKGTVTYEKVTLGTPISVNATTGDLTIAGRAPLFKGDVFNVKVRVSAAGNSKYYATSKVVTVKVMIV